MQAPGAQRRRRMPLLHRRGTTGSRVQQTVSRVGQSGGVRKPEASGTSGTRSKNARPPAKEESVFYFAALYTKRSTKKHKTYLDGFLSLHNDRKIVLFNEDGKQIAKSSGSKPLGGLKEGNTLEVGTFELEVAHTVDKDEFLSGRVFVQGAQASAPTGSRAESGESALQAGASQRGAPLPGRRLRATNSLQARHAPRRAERPGSKAMPENGSFVIQPSYTSASGAQTRAIVMDPYLGKHMRPHQREGVTYLYKCIEGENKSPRDFRGAILADSMGLGKSLQSIALMWTLLKQGPGGTPLVRKAIVVCPASLVGNWIEEVKKWLGLERLNAAQVMPGTQTFAAKQAIANFIHGNVYRLLVISYESFRNYAKELYKSGCGLLICDEGHRLKAAGGNKTIDAIKKMPCRRRLLLTGTPVQNDLDEFFAMCNFVNPGILGSLSAFRATFATPILESRDATASESARALGHARAQELGRIASSFVLRRTSKTLEKYLPPKTETVVFCRLRSRQEQLYEAECMQGFSTLAASGNMGAAFGAITRLRKVCCHPAMLDAAEIEDHEPAQEGTIDVTGPVAIDSAKMQVAMSICLAAAQAGDRVVLVSNFTSALDLLSQALSAVELKMVRLDGSTPGKVRTDMVKKFNEGRGEEAVFLLSAKAGGVGLNLIGANRLILYDPDWNPATDLQIMGRVWRDGQKKDVFVYRLLSTGTLEEKIFQRQLFKGELTIAFSDGETAPSNGSAVKGVGSDASNFSKEELRDLFTYKGSAVEHCETLEVLENSRIAARASGEAAGTAAPDTLLTTFAEFRELVQRSDRGGEYVPCGSDAVLEAALNEDLDAKGVVSYLFSTSTKSRTPESDAGRATEGDSPLSSVSGTETLAETATVTELAPPETEDSADTKAEHGRLELESSLLAAQPLKDVTNNPLNADLSEAKKRPRDSAVELDDSTSKRQARVRHRAGSSGNDPGCSGDDTEDKQCVDPVRAPKCASDGLSESPNESLVASRGPGSSDGGATAEEVSWTQALEGLDDDPEV